MTVFRPDLTGWAAGPGGFADRNADILIVWPGPWRRCGLEDRRYGWTAGLELL